MTRLPPQVQLEPHIVFEDVGKSFGGEAGDVHALSAVSFDVRWGEVFGIIGRSGAGKSTLLRTINALEWPTRGSVRIHGVNPAQLDENGLVALRRKIGMIFQHFNLLSAKTVRENIGLPLLVAGARPAQIHQRVLQLLDLVGLVDKADAYPAQLSGGQKQRVGIARALVHSPEVLLCDEATSALDPETTQSILALLRDINRQLGLTIVLITHDMAVIRAICDRVMVLDQGSVQEVGDVWKVFGAPGSHASRALLSPLRQDIPQDLAQRLQPAPSAGMSRAVLSLRYEGAHQRQGVSLQALSALGSDVTLLHGGIDRLSGHSLGQVLVSVPAATLLSSSSSSSSSLEPLRVATGADHLEVLGYVGSH
ncbi:methionine ABC transporter ATP-binding protein [Diaphorobacter caeni]|uniref:methionine ABC transporter ATP-binding protein n=1 Tax=Diaphorobacter caeni TaxID=2784387 RepID=UPI0018908F69|nr:ATP-binding cassette domain-containing protein [Diaphorobacter caeni]MBF5003775.1 ATP-binding cassette domain-containing protein [Diaphorobacter caeni]